MELAKIIEERGYLASDHDRARAQWPHSHPEFARAVQQVVQGMSRLAKEVILCKPPSPTEIARTQMWLGDAIFDLAQGRHTPIDQAIQAYRSAEPYVAIAHDDLLTAKYRANLANILLRADSRRDIVSEAIEHYRAALPLLQSTNLEIATNLRVQLALAEKTLAAMIELEVEVQARKEDIFKFLRELAAYDLDPHIAESIQQHLLRLSQLESGGDLAATLHAAEQVNQLFQELMRLATPKHAPGVRRSIGDSAMKLWSELASNGLRPHLDQHTRDRMFEVTRALVEANHVVSRGSDADARTINGNRVSIAAAEGRRLLFRSHLTWLTPARASSSARAVPNGLYATDTSLLAQIREAADVLGLQLLEGTTGQELAEARFDALRGAAVVVADLTNPELWAPVCYEIGIAIAFGKPLLILATQEGRLPFDVDLEPFRVAGGEIRTHELADAVERALVVPQRAPSAGDLSSLYRAARAAFASHPALLEELRRHLESPVEAASVLESLVRADQSERGMHHIVAYPTWPRAHAEDDERRLFHVMPFGARWSPSIKEKTAVLCRETGVVYRRGDYVADWRVVRSIWDELCVATHVLVDLTDFNANVALELGIAHALGRNALIVGQAGTAARLFPMIKGVRVSEYSESGYSAIIEQFLRA